MLRECGGKVKAKMAVATRRAAAASAAAAVTGGGTKAKQTAAATAAAIAAAAAASIEAVPSSWLAPLVDDHRRRLVSLLSFEFSRLPPAVALTLLDADTSAASGMALSSASEEAGGVGRDAMSIDSGCGGTRVTVTAAAQAGETALTAAELGLYMSPHDLRRLELYAHNMVDHHMVTDLLPVLARLVFLRRLPGMRLSPLQSAILIALALQRHPVEMLAVDISLPVTQVLALFNKAMRKISTALHVIHNAEQTAAR
jgi:N-acetyltransferase 10